MALRQLQTDAYMSFLQLRGQPVRLYALTTRTLRGLFDSQGNPIVHWVWQPDVRLTSVQIIHPATPNTGLCNHADRSSADYRAEEPLSTYGHFASNATMLTQEKKGAEEELLQHSGIVVDTDAAMQGLNANDGCLKPTRCATDRQRALQLQHPAGGEAAGRLLGYKCH